MRLWLSCLLLLGSSSLIAQAPQAPQVPQADRRPVEKQSPTHFTLRADSDHPYPLTLKDAMHLAGAQALDIRLAEARVEQAVGRLQQARALWLPTIYVGVDYLRHDGRIQDIVGTVFPTSRSAFFAGAGPSAVFALTDAFYAPLAAQQFVDASEASVRSASNDVAVAVAEAFFTLQQARGELSGFLIVARHYDQLLQKTEALAESLTPPLEILRVRSERARVQQEVQRARQRWRVASAELVRLLRLQPGVLVEPVEPPDLVVQLIEPNRSLDELIPLALTHRPELEAHQAIVGATLARLRQEKMRPLLPSVILRGTSSNPAGTFSTGIFGGGINSNLSNFDYRNDFNLQLHWEFQNLGFGNRGRVRERLAENEAATLELFRTQDRIAAEVTQAHAEVQAAEVRRREAEGALRDARELVEQSLKAISQTKSIGRTLTLVVRPQEVVAAMQTLARAYQDHYAAIADWDRGQFRLIRALGRPGI
jgi:outer membrane protein TolC